MRQAAISDQRDPSRKVCRALPPLHKWGNTRRNHTHPFSVLSSEDPATTLDQGKILQLVRTAQHYGIPGIPVSALETRQHGPITAFPTMFTMPVLWRPDRLISNQLLELSSASARFIFLNRITSRHSECTNTIRRHNPPNACPTLSRNGKKSNMIMMAIAAQTILPRDRFVSWASLGLFSISQSFLIIS